MKQINSKTNNKHSIAMQGKIEIPLDNWQFHFLVNKINNSCYRPLSIGWLLDIGMHMNIISWKELTRNCVYLHSGLEVTLFFLFWKYAWDTGSQLAAKQAGRQGSQAVDTIRVVSKYIYTHTKRIIIFVIHLMTKYCMRFMWNSTETSNYIHSKTSSNSWLRAPGSKKPINE